MKVGQTEALLRALSDAAIKAALPSRLAQFLPAKPKGKTVVIGAGKAAASMAAALETAWNAPLTGVVVTRYGQGVPLQYITVLEAAHPVPDDNSVKGAKALLAAVEGLSQDDLVIALISGGGSSLITAPADGLTLDDLKSVNKQLLSCGADIGAMNVLRKHLSLIAGGRLAKACFPAKLVTLAISDVPYDEATVIASGPTVVDPSTKEQALEVVNKYGLELPPHVLAHLKSDKCESVKQLDNCEFHLIATPMQSLKAAAELAQSQGVRAHILSDVIEGEAREAAGFHAALVSSIIHHGVPFKAPVLLLSGGETTVTLKGKGRGGRNSEFALALALALENLGVEARTRVSALAIDTDGIDGIENNAGAFVPNDFIAKCEAAGVNPKAHLANNDAYTLFIAIDCLVVTGATDTNVNDFRAIYIQ